MAWPASVLAQAAALVLLACRLSVASKPVGDASATVLHVGRCVQCTHRTLHAARDSLRALRQSDAPGARSRATVIVHAGTYAPLVLDAALDSGVSAGAPTVYAAAAGEPSPVISAGVAVPASAWTPAAGLRTEGVLQADLRSLGLSAADLGSLPDNGGSIDACDQQTLQKMQLFHEGAVGRVGPHLARHPNMGPSGDWVFLHASKAASGGFVTAPNDTARVLGWVATEEAAYLHGYWSWDWSDTIVRINGTDASSGAVLWATSSGPTVKPNARYVGLNLLSELDSPNEYYISSRNATVYFMPAAPVSQWREDPVVSVGAVAVDLDGVAHVTLTGVTVAHAKAVGISAVNVTGVTLDNCTVNGHGASGIDLRGVDSTVSNSVVFDVGCRGVTAHCGSMRTLSPGRCLVTGNTVTQMAQYKRTYQPGIHWGGVNNTYSHNKVSHGPHNCFLGGGNEVETDVGGVDNVFEYNHLDYCSFESSDTGAFYSCGQQATAFVNPGNHLRHNLFTNIANTEGSGVQGITVQAVYLDDQMSGWTVWNNTFLNCTTGVLLGGGRLNSFTENYFQNCDNGAVHFDNRGMGWQKNSPNCTGPKGGPCLPRNGDCSCEPAAVRYELSGPAGAAWRSRFPALVATLDNADCGTASAGLIPCQNVLANNTYCNVKFFVDASQQQTDSWHSTVAHNVAVPCRV